MIRGGLYLQLTEKILRPATVVYNHQADERMDYIQNKTQVTSISKSKTALREKLSLHNAKTKHRKFKVSLYVHLINILKQVI